MLTPVEDAPAVVVCNTCRFAKDQPSDETGRRGGKALADHLRSIKAAQPKYTAISIQEMSCLFSCKEHCSVHLRAPGKISYLLGRFSPTAEDAASILDYAALYAASPIGVVPYRDWPEGVKGHFIARTPPAGFVAE